MNISLNKRGISLLLIILAMLTNTSVFAQLDAKQICLYPKTNSGYDLKLKDLKNRKKSCISEEADMKIFNSAKESLELVYYTGGFYGTFTDKKSKIHLIIVGRTDGVIVDLTYNKTYVIEDLELQRKWYDLVRNTKSKVDALK